MLNDILYYIINIYIYIYIYYTCRHVYQFLLAALAIGICWLAVRVLRVVDWLVFFFFFLLLLLLLLLVLLSSCLFLLLMLDVSLFTVGDKNEN